MYTKEQEAWIAQKKEEYRHDPLRVSLDPYQSRIRFDEGRKKGQASGYYLEADNGRICDLSEEAVAIGYVYLASDYHGDLEARLQEGGRLGIGENSKL